ENNSFLIPMPQGLSAQQQARWFEFINAVHAAPARYRNHPAALATPKKQLCNQLLPNNTNNPGSGWWNGAMGQVKQPVDAYLGRVNDCGVWKDWTPGGIFKLSNAPLRNAGADYTGSVLGFWTANVDASYDDQHLWVRPTSIAGAGALKSLINQGVNIGLEILLV